VLCILGILPYLICVLPSRVGVGLPHGEAEEGPAVPGGGRVHDARRRGALFRHQQGQRDRGVGVNGRQDQGVAAADRPVLAEVREGALAGTLIFPGDSLKSLEIRDLYCIRFLLPRAFPLPDARKAGVLG
jgi:hypothetical protein